MVAAAEPRAELLRALATLAEEPGAEHPRLAEALGLPAAPTAADFTDLFVLELHPWASVQLGAEGMLGGDARDRVAGFWHALGLVPPPEPDHLGALLGLLAAVVERQAEAADEADAALLGRARAALVREHLLPWLPGFLDRVRALGAPPYRAWADLVDQVLLDEAALDVSAAGDLPLHLRLAPDLPDPRVDGGAAGFLAGLLAPVRSGMILARRDLARAGRELGLGVRQGERRYVLEAFLGQDPEGTLRWLAGEARTQAARHRDRPHPDPRMQTFWEDRAASTAVLLDELAAAEAAHGDQPGEPAGPEPSDPHAPPAGSGPSGEGEANR